MPSVRNVDTAEIRGRDISGLAYGEDTGKNSRLRGLRLRKPKPAPVGTWNLSFGTISGIGFVGSSMTFSTIFTAPSDLASPTQITLMCWAFSCYTTAFAAGACVQTILIMVSTTVERPPGRPEHRLLLAVTLYLCIAMVSVGTLLLGVAIMKKVRGAGLMAIVLPSTFVLMAICVAAYLNHVEGALRENLEGVSRGDGELERGIRRERSEGPSTVTTCRCPSN